MNLEHKIHKINLLPREGIEEKVSFFNRLRKPIVIRIVAYSLISAVAFVSAYALSSCGSRDENKGIYISCVDNDNDGYGALGTDLSVCVSTTLADCHDMNASVNPGMVEIPYNGLDDDCNTTTLDDDLDQDGYFTLTGTLDCDDSNSDVFPGAPERCDGVDNQCPGDAGFGQVDEGLVCTKIAFSSSRTPNGIYSMNPDGTDQTFLADGNNPAWSPDGSRIAYSSYRELINPTNPCSLNLDYIYWEIYVINVDGSNETKLTDNMAYYDYAHTPKWSPDGAKIAYSSTRCEVAYQIYTINADGTNLINLSNNPYGGDNQHPAWSPYGSKIVFTTYSEIHVMNADGTNPTNLTNNPSYYTNPTWSPNGSKIAYELNGEIYLINPDGTGQASLTAGTNPTWSPDSMMLAYVSGRDGDNEIYKINVDGSNDINLTNNTADDYNPAWSP